MSTDSIRAAIGEAHSKLILIGEHAVVYGKPAIAIPFPLKARSVIKAASGPIRFQSDIYTGPINGISVKMEGISACIKETLNYLSKPFGNLNIEVQSAIPLGRGLGSSAAIAVAIVRSLFSFYGQELSQKELFSLVQIAETHAHGNPSGIDMAAVSSEYPIWFEKGKAAIPLAAAVPLYIVVADTGRIGDTRTAVGKVRKKYVSEQAKVEKSLDRIKHIAAVAKDVLEEGDIYLLGELLNRNQEELVTLGISDEGLNLLIQAARDAGALGAKLTGGGLGGCMLALANSLNQAKAISQKLIKAGACKSWYFSMEGDIFYETNEGCS